MSFSRLGSVEGTSAALAGEGYLADRPLALADHPDLEPLTRGIRAAVPHADELLAGNSLASLEELATILEEI